MPMIQELIRIFLCDLGLRIAHLHWFDTFHLSREWKNLLYSLLGVLVNGIIILLLVTYIDTLVVIPHNVSIHCFDKFKIILPFGCVLVSSIIWMFHEQRTETRELAVFISALFLALLTILHVVILRVVSTFDLYHDR